MTSRAARVEIRAVWRIFVWALWMNMWTQEARTLAPDSRHIVAFRSAATTYRAADKSLAYIVVAVGVGGKASVPRP